jgi:hypothetical protein
LAEDAVRLLPKEIERTRDAGFATGSQPVERCTTDHHCPGAECHRLNDVATTPEAAIDYDCQPITDSCGNRRKNFHRLAGSLRKASRSFLILAITWSVVFLTIFAGTSDAADALAMSADSATTNAKFHIFFISTNLCFWIFDKYLFRTLSVSSPIFRFFQLSFSLFTPE